MQHPKPLLHVLTVQWRESCEEILEVGVGEYRHLLLLLEILEVLEEGVLRGSTIWLSGYECADALFVVFAFPATLSSQAEIWESQVVAFEQQLVVPDYFVSAD